MPWQKRWFQLSILLTLAFIWGSSFILMKIGLKSFSSEQAGTLRILIASLALLPLSIRELKHLRRKDLKSLLVAGFIGSFFPALLFMKAETRVDSSVTGMLNSLTPVFTLIIGLLFHKAAFKWMQVLGLSIGLVGAAGLIIAGSGMHLGNVNSYAFYVVLATSFYAINIYEVKSKLSHLKGIQITSLSFLFMGPVALIILLTTDFQPVLANPNWPLHLAAIATLAVVGSAFAQLLMNSLIRYASAIAVSSVTYIIPIFAILWGVVDGEVITLHHLGCMGLILVGVYLINWKARGR